MDASNPEVLVIGAAGYVGQALLSRLIGAGCRVAVACRPHSAFLFERYGAAVRTVAAGPTRFGVVINLAYPTGYPAHHRGRDNRRIEELIVSLAAPGARVIQVSSLAVFGFHLDLPITAGPVPMRRDFEYVESKLWLENRIARRQDVWSVEIVRLGNVWGPASPNWVIGLTERLRAGQPVLVNGTTGYCNATDVANVADYLTWLVTQPAPGRGCRYHHLAEFSAHRWSEAIEFLASELNLPMVSAQVPVGVAARSLWAEMKGSFGPIAQCPLLSLQLLRGGRVTGSYFRAGLGALPNGLAAALKRLKNGTPRVALPAPDPAEQLFLDMMNLPIEFRTKVLDGWHPVCSWQQSFDRVSAWLHHSGYI